jgi:hypothetical protein
MLTLLWLPTCVLIAIVNCAFFIFYSTEPPENKNYIHELTYDTALLCTSKFVQTLEDLLHHDVTRLYTFCHFEDNRLKKLRNVLKAQGYVIIQQASAEGMSHRKSLLNSE